ncbi:MAG: hypothetical protein DMD99_09995 [Candidatus Rokuibacteriota bacterium]|nr:MAG: hypothetical protein DMD99_09995 [Candidatus Rokubacteria bacterium]
MRTGCRRRGARGRIAYRDPWPRPARESLPERAARAVPRRHGNPHSGGVGGASVSPGAAALGRARGYLGPGAGGVQAVIKPVVALAGDVGGVRAGGGNRQRSAPPGSSSADIDSLGLPLPHAVWGRHVVAADEFWLVSTRVPNSWDSRIMPEAVELDRRTSAAFRSFRNSRWPRLFAWSGSPSVSRLRWRSSHCFAKTRLWSWYRSPFRSLSSTWWPGCRRSSAIVSADSSIVRGVLFFTGPKTGSDPGFDSGAREGELSGLRWTDLDLAGGRMTIRRQLVRARAPRRRQAGPLAGAPSRSSGRSWASQQCSRTSWRSLEACGLPTTSFATLRWTRPSRTAACRALWAIV